MSLDAINEAVEAFGGQWVKLNRKEHGTAEGTLVDIEVREKTFEGELVLSRKSGEPRKEWVITYTVDEDQRDGAEDDGTRKLSANESLQRALKKAIKDSGSKAERGGTIKMKVTEDPEKETQQAEYVAKYTPPVKTIEVEDFDEDDFA